MKRGVGDLEGVAESGGDDKRLKSEDPSGYTGYGPPGGDNVAISGAVSMKGRLLVGNKEAGVVIGKGGVNIRKIREDTSAEVRLVRLLARASDLHPYATHDRSN